MDFTLSFNMDNASFEVAPEIKINTILHLVGDRILNGETDGRIFDVNGNSIGYFEMVTD